MLLAWRLLCHGYAASLGSCTWTAFTWLTWTLHLDETKIDTLVVSKHLELELVGTWKVGTWNQAAAVSAKWSTGAKPGPARQARPRQVGKRSGPRRAAPVGPSGTSRRQVEINRQHQVAHTSASQEKDKTVTTNHRTYKKHN